MLFDGFIASAKSMLTTLSLIACAQILVCLISVTGIGVKFSGLIMEIGGGHMFLAGLMAMIATMILGMGMPTVAAYVLAASVIVPRWFVLALFQSQHISSCFIMLFSLA